LHQKCFN